MNKQEKKTFFVLNKNRKTFPYWAVLQKMRTIVQNSRNEIEYTTQLLIKLYIFMTRTQTPLQTAYIGKKRKKNKN